MAAPSSSSSLQDSVPQTDMYYEPSSYRMKCRIDSVTNLKKTLEIIETKLNEQQLKWFKEHPQFQHFFHMPRQNHKYTALWALILRTRYISNDEWWSIPNGVPLRYSIWEHALYTGLCCDPLQRNFEKDFEKEHSLSLDFAGKHLSDTSKVDIFDVKRKLQSMEVGDDDLLKMNLLFFLGSFWNRKKNKGKSHIDVFYLMIVDSLSLCEKFPWGTLSFNECMDSLLAMLKKAKGDPNAWCSFSCFITPLELFAFDAIPQLKKKYLADVDKSKSGCKSTCPRMCKMEYVKTGEKSYPLQSIYNAIGADKDFPSILLPEVDEQHLVAHVVERVTHHPTIKTWKAVLVEEKGSIFWDNLYQSDQRNRVVNEENPGLRKRKRGNSSARETENNRVDQLETTVETAVPQPQAEESPFQSRDELEQTGGDELTDGSEREREQPFSPSQPQPEESPFQSRDEPEQMGGDELQSQPRNEHHQEFPLHQNQEDDGQLQLHQKPLKVYVRRNKNRQERVTNVFERLVGYEPVVVSQDLNSGGHFRDLNEMSYSDSHSSARQEQNEVNKETEDSVTVESEPEQRESHNEISDSEGQNEVNLRRGDRNRGPPIRYSPSVTKPPKTERKRKIAGTERKKAGKKKSNAGEKRETDMDPPTSAKKLRSLPDI